MLSPENLGLYAYAWNNPVIVRDPDGRCPACGPEALIQWSSERSLPLEAQKTLERARAVGTLFAAAFAAVAYGASYLTAAFGGESAAATAGAAAATTQTPAGQQAVQEVESLAPTVESIAPEVESVAPQLESIAPRAESVAPQAVREQLLGTLRARALQQAGFSTEGAPIILDENLAARGVAEALRAQGFNVRSTIEIFGAGAKDPDIRSFAEGVGARVLTADRGRQIGEGFGQLAIRVPGQVGQDLNSIARLLSETLKQGKLR